VRVTGVGEKGPLSAGDNATRVLDNYFRE
jgi:hypothetical protein